MKLFTVKNRDTGAAHYQVTAESIDDVVIADDEIAEDGDAHGYAEPIKQRQPTIEELRNAAMCAKDDEIASLWEVIGVLWDAVNPLSKADAKTKAKHKRTEAALKRVIQRIESAKVKYPYPVYPDAMATLATTLAPMTLISRAEIESHATMRATLAPMTLKANSLPVRSAMVSSILSELTISMNASVEITATVSNGLLPVTLESFASVDVPIIPVID